MSSETKASTLDWRELAPSREIHSCDCSYCDMDGELEDQVWPSLVTVGEYVTDRYLAILADRAPLPEGYEGNIHAITTEVPAKITGGEVTDEPPSGVHFRRSVIKACELTGWRLRVIAGAATDMHAVIDDTGTRIGTAIAARQPVADEWGQEFSRPYAEEA